MNHIASLRAEINAEYAKPKAKNAKPLQFTRDEGKIKELQARINRIKASSKKKVED